VKLKVLGTGNAFNQQSRMNSSYLVEVGDKNVLIDCGFTVPFALQKENISFSTLDYILITHYHGDHFAGLSALLLALKYITPQEKKLTIIGPGSVMAKVKELQKVLYSGTEKLLDELNLEFFSVDQKGGDYDLGDFKLSVLPMVHSDDAIPVGYIIQNQSYKLGFSGDTCWHEGVEKLIQKSDSIILECNFIERIGEGHISVQELESSQVVLSNKSNIYLTHLYEGSSEQALKLNYNVLRDGEDLVF